MRDAANKTKQGSQGGGQPKPTKPPARAELIWEGKYDADGRCVAPLRVALPFQTVETVNESAQDRQRTLQFGPGFGEEMWRNRLIWGDKKYVLPSLLPEFAGKVNLIYIDLPFDTGADFSFTATVPDHTGTEANDSFTFTKEPSIIEHKAYRDTWGRGLNSYLQWFYETTIFLHEFLHETGSIYVHLDYHVSHYAKAILDEIFGSENFRNEIVWKRQTAHSDPKRYGPIHDVIFYYGKSSDIKFNIQHAPTTKAISSLTIRSGIRTADAISSVTLQREDLDQVFSTPLEVSIRLPDAYGQCSQTRWTSFFEPDE